MSRDEYKKRQYQDVEYYENNKDNFLRSLRAEGMESFTPGAIFMENLMSTSFLNFGQLKKEEYYDKEYYYLLFPKGLTVYHGSRDLQMNSLFSDYPIKEYKNFETPEENKANILKDNDDPTRFSFPKTSSDYISNYHVSFYSTPPNNREYLYKGIGNVQGFRYKDNLSDVRKRSWNYVTGELFSEEDEILVDYTGDMAKNKVDSENLETYIVYKTKKDIKLLLLAIDKFAAYDISNHENMIKDLKIIGLNKLASEYPHIFGYDRGLSLENILRIFYIDQPDIRDNYAQMLALFLGESDIPHLAEIFSQIDNNQNYMELSNFYRMAIKLKLDLEQFEEQDDYFDKVYEYIILYQIDKTYRDMKNYRFSTYSTDRPFFNAFENLYSESFDGTISGPIFNYRGRFDGEMALFYAPDVLERNPENIFDIHYGMGFGGFLDELRRYEITNPCNLRDKETGNTLCHTGHLFEHSSWTLLYSKFLIGHLRLSGFTITDFEENLILFSSFFHDIGKAGACGKAANIAFENHHQTFIPDDSGYYIYDETLTDIKEVRCENKKEVFKYENIPDHPERGYRYLTGELMFVTSSIFDSDDFVIINLLEKFKENVPSWINSNFLKYTALVVGSHYYAGTMLYSQMENLNTNIPEYIEKIKFYYNSLFSDYTSFEDVVKLIFIVSTADILAQRALSFGLNIEEHWGILNEFPITEVYDLKWVGNRNFTEFTRDFETIYTSLTFKLSSGLQPTNFLSNYNVKNNSMIYVDSLEALFKIYESILPKFICFDFDATLANIDMNFDTSSPEFGKFNGYIYIEKTLKLLQSLQFARELGVQIALISRHYFPDEMDKELQYSEYLSSIYGEPKGLLDFFDSAVISRTGAGFDQGYHDINHAYITYQGIDLNSMSDFAYINGRRINLNSRLYDAKEKKFHFELINATDAILFDDDESYLSHENDAIPLDVTPIRVLETGPLDDRQTFGLYFYNKINS